MQNVSGVIQYSIVHNHNYFDHGPYWRNWRQKILKSKTESKNLVNNFSTFDVLLAAEIQIILHNLNEVIGANKKHATRWVLWLGLSQIHHIVERHFVVKMTIYSSISRLSLGKIRKATFFLHAF